MFLCKAVLFALSVVVIYGKKKDSATKREVESTAGKLVQIKCGPIPKNATKVTWKVGELKSAKDLASATSRFNFITEGDLTIGLTFPKVDYSDRDSYNCYVSQTLSVNGTNVTSTSITAYRLRVRDPLGALWPVLGMLIGAVILVIIIGAHEFMANKQSGSK